MGKPQKATKKRARRKRYLARKRARIREEIAKAKSK